MAGFLPQVAAADAAIRAFNFDNFGHDEIDSLLHDRPDDQEWVADLASAVLEAVLSAHG